MSPITVKNISKETEGRTITVKILRLWLPLDAKKRPVSIETILMDCQGTIISGYVKRALLTNFRKMLKEGDTVEISDFGVDENPATKWHKARVDHAYKLLFNYITRVTRAKPDICILSNGLNLIPFDDIPKWRTEFYIDVIGRVTEIGEISYVESARARKLDIKIQDERNTILNVVLWEGYADKLLATAPNTESLTEEITIVLQFAAKSVWMKELRIQTTKDATKMMINEDIPEVIDFNLRKKELGTSTVSRTITFTSEARTLKAEEWLNVANHLTIPQLRTCRQPGQYILFIMFKNIDGEEWYYNACGKCKSMCQRDSIVGDKCIAKCNAVMETIIPRFRVKVKGTSGKSYEDITLVMFEDIITQLIGKSSVTVLKSIREEDEFMMPMDFLSMLNKTYLVKVRVSREYNINKDSNEYTVDKITQDESIIGQYCELALSVNQTESTSSMGNLKGKEKMQESANQGSNNSTDESLTPMKRCIVDVEEYEDSGFHVNSSSTKVAVKREKML